MTAFNQSAVIVPSIQNYEHVLLEVAMCEKCRVTQQGKGEGVTNSIFFFGGSTFAGQLQPPLPPLSSCHAMSCLSYDKDICHRGNRMESH